MSATLFHSYMGTTRRPAPAVRTDSSLYQASSPERDLLKRIVAAADSGDASLTDALYEEARELLEGKHDAR